MENKQVNGWNEVRRKKSRNSSRNVEIKKGVKTSDTASRPKSSSSKLRHDDYNKVKTLYSLLTKILGADRLTEMSKSISRKYNKELTHVNNSDGLIEVLGTFGKTNYFPDIYFINPLIKKLGEPNKRRGRNPLFSSLSNNERLDICKYLFDYASYWEIADVFSYTSLIDAAGKNNDLPRAIATFEEAKEKGLADVFIYNSLIGAAMKDNDLPRAIST